MRRRRCGRHTVPGGHRGIKRIKNVKKKTGKRPPFSLLATAPPPPPADSV